MKEKIFWYNWKELKEICGNCNNILKFIHIIIGNKLYTYKDEINIKKFQIVKKHSYARNINLLLEDKKSSNNEKCIALILGARRNYADYKLKNDSSLPIMIAEEIFDLKMLQNNSLLEIKDNIINFKYN